MALYENANNGITSYNATFFDSFFLVEHVPRQIRNFITKKNFMTNTYRIQSI